MHDARSVIPLTFFAEHSKTLLEVSYKRYLSTGLEALLPNAPPNYALSTPQILAEVALEAIRGRLVGTRLSLVRAAFTRLRGSGDAPADAAPAVNVAIQFDPTGHPDVMASRRPPEVRPQRVCLLN